MMKYGPPSQSVSELARSNLELISIKRKMEWIQSRNNLETPNANVKFRITYTILANVHLGKSVLANALDKS